MRHKKSFWAFLGRELPEAPEVVAERIRTSMLLALATHCAESDRPVKLRVQIARGIYELWYLRPDLMQAISVSAGELTARNELTKITALFMDFQPLAGLNRIKAPSR